jgi:Domain of unknown function (DUF3883)
MDKVLWVKFGWSDYYQGGPVDGNFGYLNENRHNLESTGGHEAFNFMPNGDGSYFCYVPPQAGSHAPWNEDNTGWTVICFAKHPKQTGIHIVGWYENATLLGDWVDRKQTNDGTNSILDKFSYCITSKTAYFIPPELRNSTFSHKSVKQGKYSFLSGPNVKITRNKQDVLSIIKNRMKELLSSATRNPSSETTQNSSTGTDPLAAFGSPEHRKAVETAAENAVIKFYKSRGFSTERVTHINCGFDFIFRKMDEQYNVEVKGTSGESERFFLTENENLNRSNDFWRLSMVTNALSDAPIVKTYTNKEVSSLFHLDPLVYIGRKKSAA